MNYKCNWKPDEIERFEWALNQHGKDFTLIAEHVKTRSCVSVKGWFNRHVRDKSAYGLQNGLWTAAEKQKFEVAIRQFGKNRRKISEFVGSKSARQV